MDRLLKIKKVSADSTEKLSNELDDYLKNGWSMIGEMYTDSKQEHSHTTVTYSDNCQYVKPTIITNTKYSQRISNNGTPLRDDDMLVWKMSYGDVNSYKAYCRNTLVYKSSMKNIDNSYEFDKFLTHAHERFSRGDSSFIWNMFDNILLCDFDSKFIPIFVPRENLKFVKHPGLSLNCYYINGENFSNKTIEREIKKTAEKHFDNIKELHKDL